jgi:glycerophosphodiester phosphodiesterase
LEQNLTKAESFYKTRHASIQQRVNVLHHHYGITKSTTFDHANELELEDLTAAFGELHGSLKQLQWYGLVNFNKITDRLGKLGQGEELSWHPLKDVLDISASHHALQKECLKDLVYVDHMLARLRSRRAEAGRCSSKESLLLQNYYDELRPASSLSTACFAIDQDDASALDQLLQHSRKAEGPDERDQQRLIFALIHCATLNGSKRCIERLVGRIEDLRYFDDHLHWLVIKTGRRKMLYDGQVRVSTAPEATVQSTVVTEAIDQVVQVVHRLGFMLTDVLHKQDSFGRLPLHHAVHYGLHEVCQAILRYMNGHEAVPSMPFSPALLPDCEGLCALDLAILTGNAAVTKILLEDHDCRIGEGNNNDTAHFGILPGRLLTAALVLNSFEIIQHLLAYPIDVNYKHYNDETALYLAVRSRRLEYVTILLAQPNKNDEIEMDTPEAVHGRTPLILASVNGDLPVVELLLREGADPKVQDLFGWTAKDHAAFRGHLPMAKTLMALETASTNENSRVNRLPRMKRRERIGRSTVGNSTSSDQHTPPGYSEVFVNLGPLDTYHPVIAVNLAPYVSPDAYNPQREAAFKVKIRAVDGDQSNHVIQLPIMEDMANTPWRFLTRNAREFKLAFDIFHADTDIHNDGPLIGSAIALLASHKQGLGSKRESVIRDFTIPILQKETLQYMGTVTFYFLVITPFPHPRPAPGVGRSQDFGRHGSPTIIGHRGAFQSPIS